MRCNHHEGRWIHADRDDEHGRSHFFLDSVGVKQSSQTFSRSLPEANTPIGFAYVYLVDGLEARCWPDVQVTLSG